ncbi:MAG: chemotaxis protein CheA [Polyangiaceae bacterium]
MSDEIYDDEVVREFLVESYENLDQLDRDFVALEADPGAKDRIAGIFRTVHTIKGTSGFLGFSRLESLTHAGESLLSKLRDGVLVLTPEATSALLAMVDQVRAFLSQVENTGQEGDADCSALTERLGAIARGQAAAQPGPAAEEPAASRPEPAAEKEPAAPQTSAGADTAAESNAGYELFDVAPAVEAPAAAPRKPEPAVAEKPEPARAAPTGDESAPAVKGSPVAESSVRVDVGLLDTLMNLVGELVLARNQIIQFGAAVEDSGFANASQRLNLITTELQEGVMKTRMQPIGNVWNKLPRVVRDLSIACGKQVRVEMHGKETELDRTIIEAIKDPLTHIVRNAVDHGIESPEVRAGKGKPQTGTLSLRAFHEGGQVNIEISDDGGGINPEAVREKAIRSGVATAERAARMSERELCQLIFLPGFSTAKKVSNVSGRGVGMDVVKTNIEKIGGTVDLLNAAVGTTIKIKIPLTLAIVPALIITSQGHRFAIPQVSLLELVRLEREQAETGIEFIQGVPVYRLRGNLLPLVRLDRVLGLTAADADTTFASEDGSVNIVVLQADDRSFGLVVDEIRDTEEIVVKPLGKELKTLSVFAGATIMGDGRVALILDVLGLAQRAGAISAGRERIRGEHDAALDAVGAVQEKQTLLIVRVGNGDRLAIPLSLVARLEEFPRERLEQAGARAVVQYRGELLPLLELSRVLGASASAASAADGTVYVVVYSEGDRTVGLVVDQILDIVEEAVRVDTSMVRAGISGTAVIQGRVTELLDAAALLPRQERSAA